MANGLKMEVSRKAQVIPSFMVMDVIDRVPSLGYRAAGLQQMMRDKRTEHRQYIRAHGQDMPEIREWKWPY